MGANSKESSRAICASKYQPRCTAAERSGARLRWKTPRQFPGESLKSISDQELLSNQHRCQSRCAGVPPGRRLAAILPFPLCTACPWDSLLLQPAVRFWGCSCHQLSEAGSLLSPSLSCLKSSSAIIPGLSRLLRHIGSDNNGSQSKAYTTCPFV